MIYDIKIIFIQFKSMELATFSIRKQVISNRFHDN